MLLIDFADNCRDQEALALPFLEWDLSRPIPSRAKYGICCDVMEHIPDESLEKVIRNIMEAAEVVFFQISTFPDDFGQLIGQPLHLSVHPHDWWLGLFENIEYAVNKDIDGDNASIFIERRKKSALAA